MNKHIELVKKWLDNPDSVTQEELKANVDAANAADAAYDDVANAAANAAYAAYAAADVASANAAYDAAYDAYDDVANAAAYAAYFVKKYEKLTEGE